MYKKCDGRADGQTYGRADGRLTDFGTKFGTLFFSNEKAGIIIIQQSHQTRSIISSCLAKQFYAAQHSHPHLYILLPAALQL